MKNTNLRLPGRTWQNQSVLILSTVCIFFLFIRIFLRGHYLELDEAEQMVLAQKLSFGYINQPPLYSWLQFSVFQLFGSNLFSLALVKYSLLFGCLYYYHQICRFYCPSLTIAWCATLSWALIPSISMDLLKDNTHSILALFAACLTWHSVLKMQHSSSLGPFIRLGIVLGLGFLSKFNYFLFLLPLMLSLLTLYSYRPLGKYPYLLISIAIAMIIASPYFLWLYQQASLGLNSVYKLVPQTKSHAHGFGELMKTVLFFMSPVLVLARLFFPVTHVGHHQVLIKKLLFRYHLFALLILFLVVLLFGFRDFETRWLIPILFLTPLLVFSQLDIRDSIAPKRITIFLFICILTQCIFLSLLVYRGNNGRQQENAVHFSTLAQNIAETKKPIRSVISDSLWLLGNVYSSTHNPIYFINHKEKLHYPQGHILLIWEGQITPIWATIVFPQGKKNQIQQIKNNQGGIMAEWIELDYQEHS